MKVESSMISEIEHNGKDLIITFTTGGTYLYENVPTSVYEEFTKAPSKGQYFHKNILKKYFYYTRLK